MLPTAPPWDPLSGLLRSLHITSIVPRVSEVRAPWGVRVPTGTGGFYAVFEGEVHLSSDAHGESVRAGPGDVLVLTRGGEHVVSHAPGHVGTPLEHLLTRDELRARHGVQLDGPGARTRYLCGALFFDRPSQDRIRGVLPAVIRIEAAGTDSVLASLLRTLERISRDDEPGVHALMSQLGASLFLEVVRRYLAELPARSRSGYGSAILDPHLGPVLGLIHAEPARDWTLEQLANEAGLSRTVFCERFARAMGMPPNRYLRQIRLEAAASMLQSTELAVAEVSRRCGYASEGAFSNAFRAWAGVTPTTYRRSDPSGPIASSGVSAADSPDGGVHP